MTPQNIDTIEAYLEEKWSPEQIAGRLKKDKCLTVSHETIYQHIYKDRKKRRLSLQNTYDIKVKNIIAVLKPLQDAVVSLIESISQKGPRSVENKTRYGHWEGDLVIGLNIRERY